MQGHAGIANPALDFEIQRWICKSSAGFRNPALDLQSQRVLANPALDLLNPALDHVFPALEIEKSSAGFHESSAGFHNLQNPALDFEIQRWITRARALVIFQFQRWICKIQRWICKIQRWICEIQRWICEIQRWISQIQRWNWWNCVCRSVLQHPPGGTGTVAGVPRAPLLLPQRHTPPACPARETLQTRVSRAGLQVCNPWDDWTQNIRKHCVSRAGNAPFPRPSRGFCPVSRAGNGPHRASRAGNAAGSPGRSVPGPPNPALFIVSPARETL